MSDSANKHQDQLIEDALALLQDAVRKEPLDVKHTLPHARFDSVETNVLVTTQHPDGHRSVVATSSVEIVTTLNTEQHPATPPSPGVGDEDREATASQPTEHSQIDLVERTLSIMRIASEEPTIASSPPVTERAAKLPSPKRWLDMERADRRRRVEAFKATQERFQRERERYCAAALDAAKAGEWKPQQT